MPADALHVHVLPELIAIEGKAEQKPASGTVVFSEFGTKQLFRQYKLRSPVDVDQVVATLEHGMLVVVAPKTQVTRQSTEVPIHTKLVKANPTALVATGGRLRNLNLPGLSTMPWNSSHKKKA